jgi:hypothetical protein
LALTFRLATSSIKQLSAETYALVIFLESADYRVTVLELLLAVSAVLDYLIAFVAF